MRCKCRKTIQSRRVEELTMPLTAKRLHLKNVLSECLSSCRDFPLHKLLFNDESEINKFLRPLEILSLVTWSACNSTISRGKSGTEIDSTNGSVEPYMLWSATSSCNPDSLPFAAGKKKPLGRRLCWGFFCQSRKIVRKMQSQFEAASSVHLSQNVCALPSCSALSCASVTTLGQRARVSVLGKAPDTVSNYKIEPSASFLPRNRPELRSANGCASGTTRGVFRGRNLTSVTIV